VTAEQVTELQSRGVISVEAVATVVVAVAVAVAVAIVVEHSTERSTSILEPQHHSSVWQER